MVPVDDLVMPTPQGAAPLRQLRCTVDVGGIIDDFTKAGVSQSPAVDVVEAAQSLFSVPGEAHLAMMSLAVSEPLSLVSAPSLRRS